MTNLCTTAEFKAFYGISVSTYDSFLDVLVAQITARIARWCNRASFDTATYNEDYDGSGTEYLALRNVPVASITSVKVDGGRGFGTETLLTASSYVVEKEAGLLMLVPELLVGSITVQGTFPCGNKNVRVAYSAGYDTPFPQDLKLAALTWTAQVFNRRRYIGFGSLSASNVSMQFDVAAGRGAIPDEVRQMLAPFRRPSMVGGFLTVGS